MRELKCNAAYKQWRYNHGEEDRPFYHHCQSLYPFFSASSSFYYSSILLFFFLIASKLPQKTTQNTKTYFFTFVTFTHPSTICFNKSLTKAGEEKRSKKSQKNEEQKGNTPWTHKVWRYVTDIFISLGQALLPQVNLFPFFHYTHSLFPQYTFKDIIYEGRLPLSSIFIPPGATMLSLGDFFVCDFLEVCGALLMRIMLASLRFEKDLKISIVSRIYREIQSFFEPKWSPSRGGNI